MSELSRLHATTQKKIAPTPNTVGWGNKLVTVFADPFPKLYLDSLLLNYLP